MSTLRREWLSFGISRDTNNNPNPGQLNYTNPGTYVNQNTGTNNAILKFQTYRHIDITTAPTSTTAQNSPNVFDVTSHVTYPSGAWLNTVNPSVSLQDQDPGKYYPIQMFDPREGLFRDAIPYAATNCPAYGVMNIIELDVNNLRRWLNGSLAPSPATNAGTNTESVSQNGYVVYFGDRRGMQQDPNAPSISGGTAARATGGFGFEDVVNPAASTTLGTPNLTLDSGEDSNLNGVLDKWGAASVGTAFNVTTIGGTSALPYSTPGAGLQRHLCQRSHVDDGREQRSYPESDSPYMRKSGPQEPCLRLSPCTASGERYARPTSSLTPELLRQRPWADSRWPARIRFMFWATTMLIAPRILQRPSCTATTSTTCHVSSAVIADAVTLLSNPGLGTTASPGWSDFNDWTYPVSPPGNRIGQSSWYRLAIAAGKNPTFQQPTGTAQEFGTDGGVHNFLRYIESWGWPAGTPTCCSLNYKGSIVSLYYSEYSTSNYKGSGTVYVAPSRGYSFDIDFLTIALEPPGTPKFRDVDNVGFQQIFTPY